MQSRERLPLVAFEIFVVLLLLLWVAILVPISMLLVLLVEIVGFRCEMLLVVGWLISEIDLLLATRSMEVDVLSFEVRVIAMLEMGLMPVCSPKRIATLVSSVVSSVEMLLVKVTGSMAIVIAMGIVTVRIGRAVTAFCYTALGSNGEGDCYGYGGDCEGRGFHRSFLSLKGVGFLSTTQSENSANLLPRKFFFL